MEDNGTSDEAITAALPSVYRSNIREFAISRNPRLPQTYEKLCNLSHLVSVPWFDKILLMLAVRQIPGFGNKSPFRVIPTELIRGWIAPTLPVESVQWILDRINSARSS
jgi:hypothetical protein